MNNYLSGRLVSVLTIRDALIHPPDPPFTIAIATEQPPQVADNRDIFPVQFKDGNLSIARLEEFIPLLGSYETLIQLGFSKQEITTGKYRSDRLISAVGAPIFWELEEAIERYKKTRLLHLVDFVSFE
jgi:hypothetical protein